MLDPRITKLAELLVDYSIELTAEDRLLIHAYDMPEEAIIEVIKAAQNTGTQIALRLENHKVKRQLLKGISKENATLICDNELHEMKHFTAYVVLRGNHNISEYSDVPSNKMATWNSAYRHVLDQRVNNTKWVVLRWPTSSMAQLAAMSTECFEDFYFKVCTLDYKKMAEASEPLKELMDKTKEVHILSPGTDLKFSIEGLPGVPCVGHRNIPDGECYSCPVKDSMNGVIQYNTVSPYNGTEYQNVRFEVKQGKIIEATCENNNNQKLNELLDTDESARYFGEWSLGYNPFILHPMKDILFDEKIAGSFHLTPGQAYEDCDNGNRSAVHWDIVHIQRPEYGGGEIYFDGKLIRKDGLFVLPELERLNPENFEKSF